MIQFDRRTKIAHDGRGGRPAGRWAMIKDTKGNLVLVQTVKEA